MRRGASSRAFSRWRMRCAQPIRLSYHLGLVEGSIFSRPGVLVTVPSEIFSHGQVKATEDHLTTAHFWAINEFTYYQSRLWCFIIWGGGTKVGPVTHTPKALPTFTYTFLWEIILVLSTNQSAPFAFQRRRYMNI